MINRKAELTTKQLVTLIILILSFVIILFLIFKLNLGGTANREICHNSILLKDKSKLISGPLDCKTEYVCILGGGECLSLNPAVTIEVDEKNQNEIFKALAEEMSSCWWMFGEGKVDYGGGSTETSVQYALCSIIEFDDEVQKEIPEISYSEFYNYLASNKKDESQTYFKYLYEVSDLSSFKPQKQIKVDIDIDKISTSEKYSIITGVDKKILDIISDDDILRVYIIPTSETSQRVDESGEFLTKP